MPQDRSQCTDHNCTRCSKPPVKDRESLIYIYINSTFGAVYRLSVVLFVGRGPVISSFQCEYSILTYNVKGDSPRDTEAVRAQRGLEHPLTTKPWHATAARIHFENMISIVSSFLVTSAAFEGRVAQSKIEMRSNLSCLLFTVTCRTLAL